MYKFILWSLVGVLIVIGGVFGFLVYSDSKKPVSQKVEAPVEEDKQLVEVEVPSGDEEATMEGKNPFNSSVDVKELKEENIREYLHCMAHQKVKADDKWGFFQITEERINWLLEALEHGSYKNESTYRGILERWQAGDFSQVDKDHNAIWKLQGGKLGKATGILSPEEEKKYIENTKEGTAHR